MPWSLPRAFVALAGLGTGAVLLTRLLFRPSRSRPPQQSPPPTATTTTAIATRASSTLDFLLMCGQLKKNKRTGWVDNNVALPESIADHMYRMAIMAMVIDDPCIDRLHAMKLALVHDMCESLVPDYTPRSGVSAEEKLRLETWSMKTLHRTLSPSAPDLADELLALFDEYNARATPEARFVKDFDRLEMLIQAYEYEHDQHMDLGDFFDSTVGKIKHPITQAIEAEVRARRGLAPINIPSPGT